jgi:hypothetical protein
MRSYADRYAPEKAPNYASDPKWWKESAKLWVEAQLAEIAAKMPLEKVIDARLSDVGSGGDDTPRFESIVKRWGDRIAIFADRFELHSTLALRNMQSVKIFSGRDARDSDQGISLVAEWAGGTDPMIIADHCRRVDVSGYLYESGPSLAPIVMDSTGIPGAGIGTGCSVRYSTFRNRARSRDWRGTRISPSSFTNPGVENQEFNGVYHCTYYGSGIVPNPYHPDNSRWPETPTQVFNVVARAGSNVVTAKSKPFNPSYIGVRCLLENGLEAYVKEFTADTVTLDSPSPTDVTSYVDENGVLVKSYALFGETIGTHIEIAPNSNAKSTDVIDCTLAGARYGLRQFNGSTQALHCKGGNCEWDAYLDQSAESYSETRWNTEGSRGHLYMGSHPVSLTAPRLSPYLCRPGGALIDGGGASVRVLLTSATLDRGFPHPSCHIARTVRVTSLGNEWIPGLTSYRQLHENPALWIAPDGEMGLSDAPADRWQIAAERPAAYFESSDSEGALRVRIVDNGGSRLTKRIGMILEGIVGKFSDRNHPLTLLQFRFAVEEGGTLAGKRLRCIEFPPEDVWRHVGPSYFGAQQPDDTELAPGMWCVFETATGKAALRFRTKSGALRTIPLEA